MSAQISWRFSFWSLVKSFETTCAQTFVICRFSCSTCHIASLSMDILSAISRILSRRSSRTIFSISRLLLVVFDMLGVVNVHHLQYQSGLHEIFCAIQKRGFLTCILCRKLPSKLEFYQKFQVNSLLSFRVKHFSAAVTKLLATMSNLLLLQAKVFSDAQKNMHLLSTSRYLICLKYNSNFVCNLSENCRLQLCAFLTSHSQKKTYSFIFFATNFELLQLKNFFFWTCKSTRTRTRTFLRYSYSSTFFNISTRTRSFLRYSYSEVEYSTPWLDVSHC